MFYDIPLAIVFIIGIANLFFFIGHSIGINEGLNRRK